MGAGTAPVPFGGGSNVGPLGADEVFIADNLDGRTYFGIAGGFRFERCDGLVVVSRFEGRSAGGLDLGAVDCARVVFVDCATFSSPGPLLIQRSHATLVDCESISPLNGYVFPWLGPGSAVYVDERSVDFVGGYYQGGDEIIRMEPFFYYLDAESAVAVSSGSSVRASEGAVFVGGDGNYSPDGYGITVAASTVPVVVDLSVLTTTRFPTGRRELTSLTAGVPLRGASFPVRAVGPRNSLVTVFASLPSPTSPLDTSIGRIVVDPVHHVVAGAGLVDAQRKWTTVVSVPAQVPESLTLIWQAVSLNQAGAFEIGSPTATVVR